MPRTQTYMQARDWRWKYAGGATEKGACLALSIEWIIRNAAGADFFDWLGASMIATGQAGSHADVANQDVRLGLAKAGEPVIVIHQHMASQRQIVQSADKDLVGPAKFDFVTGVIEAASNLRKISKMIEFLDSDRRRTDASMADWAGELGKVAGYKYISIGGYRKVDSSDFQHGIAAFVDDSGKFRLFDPNIGEFTGTIGGDMVDDLTGIFRTFYGLVIREAGFLNYR